MEMEQKMFQNHVFFNLFIMSQQIFNPVAKA